VWGIVLKKNEISNFNLPNTLTILRILAVPFFIYFLFQKELYYNTIAFTIFCMASITDLIDGYLARKWNQTTEFGKFLDPLADKVLVLGAFASLLLLNEQLETWMLFLIILRDMLITTLRYIGITLGKPIRTTSIAKLKTFFQMSAIIIILMFLMIVSSGKQSSINKLYYEQRNLGKVGYQIAYENYSNFLLQYNSTENLETIISHLASFAPYYIMLITTIITVLSGLRYIVSNRELLKIKNLLEVVKHK
jgi:cardiolipin synthase (CMP-forming)